MRSQDLIIYTEPTSEIGNFSLDYFLNDLILRKLLSCLIMKQFSLDLFESKKINNQQHPEILTFPSGEPIPDGEIVIYRDFFQKIESDHFFEELHNKISWQQNRIKMFGKEFDVPRLEAWYGDKGKSYAYSGILMNPLPWTPTLLLIKDKIEKVVKLEFNSVLVNLYRHGQDYVSWHSDDEPELGTNPVIASVSFGETRRFLLRHKYNKELEKVEVILDKGSLLIMKGSTQHFWKHQIPKTSKKISPRINLTFRIIKEIEK